MKYMVKVVSGGCCLGDVNPAAVERMIQAQANQGWRFAQMETVINTMCLFLHRNKTIISFYKNDNEDNVLLHENKLENPNEMSLNIQRNEKAETTQNSSAISEEHADKNPENINGVYSTSNEVAPQVQNSVDFNALLESLEKTLHELEKKLKPMIKTAVEKIQNAIKQLQVKIKEADIPQQWLNFKNSLTAKIQQAKLTLKRADVSAENEMSQTKEKVNKFFFVIPVAILAVLLTVLLVLPKNAKHGTGKGYSVIDVTKDYINGIPLEAGKIIVNKEIPAKTVKASSVMSNEEWKNITANLNAANYDVINDDLQKIELNNINDVYICHAKNSKENDKSVFFIYKENSKFIPEHSFLKGDFYSIKGRTFCFYEEFDENNYVLELEYNPENEYKHFKTKAIVKFNNQILPVLNASLSNILTNEVYNFCQKNYDETRKNCKIIEYFDSRKSRWDDIDIKNPPYVIISYEYKGASAASLKVERYGDYETDTTNIASLLTSPDGKTIELTARNFAFYNYNGPKVIFKSYSDEQGNKVGLEGKINESSATYEIYDLTTFKKLYDGKIETQQILSIKLLPTNVMSKENWEEIKNDIENVMHGNEIYIYDEFRQSLIISEELEKLETNKKEETYKIRISIQNSGSYEMNNPNYIWKIKKENGKFISESIIPEKAE